MKIIVNGRPEEVSARTLGEYSRLHTIVSEGILIVHNGSVVDRNKWENTVLNDSDSLEILGFVGGG